VRPARPFRELLQEALAAAKEGRTDRFGHAFREEAERHARLGPRGEDPVAQALALGRQALRHLARGEREDACEKLSQALELHPSLGGGLALDLAEALCPETDLRHIRERLAPRKEVPPELPLLALLDRLPPEFWVEVLRGVPRTRSSPRKGRAEAEAPGRLFTLSPEDFALLNPNTRTCPVFRTRQDAELTKAIYRRVPVLWREAQAVPNLPEENPWKVVLRQGLFNMTADSDLFRTREDLEAQGFRLVGNRFVRGEEVYLPLYEAKMFWHYDHRFATFEGKDTRDVEPGEKEDPTFLPLPRYWVPKGETEARLRKAGWERKWLLSFRNIARSTDERTVIFAALPRVGANNNALLLLSKASRAVLAFFANFNALPLDYVVRQKVGGTSLTFHYLKQFPILPPDRYTPKDLRFIVPRALELAYTAWDLAPLAQDVWEEADEGLRGAIRAWAAGARLHPDTPPEWVDGPYPFPPFLWDEERRALLRAELDAYYARLYSLNRKQLRYILDPQDLTPRELEDILSDYEEVEDPLDEKAYRKRVEKSAFPGETFRVLKDKDLKRYGEYRTRRLVLEAWERLGAGN
jgi:hypothetical protein